MFHPFELDLIYYIHQFRTPITDFIFQFLNFFDRIEFFFILVPAIWLGLHWKSGLKLLCILLISFICNYLFKEFFAYPRPFHIDPSLGLVHVHSFGFPSGAAQSAVLLSGILISTVKSSWKWLLAFSYFLLISFSRLYLGVHFLSDILGGWIIGLALFLLYCYAGPWVEKKLQAYSHTTLFFASQIFLLFLGFILHSETTFRVNSIAMGIGTGLLLSYHYQLLLPPSKNMNEFLMRASVGVAGTFLCYGLIYTLSSHQIGLLPINSFFFLGLWTTFGGPWVYAKLIENKVFA